MSLVAPLSLRSPVPVTTRLPVLAIVGGAGQGGDGDVAHRQRIGGVGIGGSGSIPAGGAGQVEGGAAGGGGAGLVEDLVDGGLVGCR